jgi:hypothetical protein
VHPGTQLSVVWYAPTSIFWPVSGTSGGCATPFPISPPPAAGRKSSSLTLRSWPGTVPVYMPLGPKANTAFPPGAPPGPRGVRVSGCRGPRRVRPAVAGAGGAVSKADEGASGACKSSRAVVCRCAKLAEEWPIAEWPTSNQGRGGGGGYLPERRGPAAAAPLRHGVVEDDAVGVGLGELELGLVCGVQLDVALRGAEDRVRVELVVVSLQNDLQRAVSCTRWWGRGRGSGRGSRQRGDRGQGGGGGRGEKKGGEQGGGKGGGKGPRGGGGGE